MLWELARRATADTREGSCPGRRPGAARAWAGRAGRAGQRDEARGGSKERGAERWACGENAPRHGSMAPKSRLLEARAPQQRHGKSLAPSGGSSWPRLMRHGEPSSPHALLLAEPPPAHSQPTSPPAHRLHSRKLVDRTKPTPAPAPKPSPIASLCGRPLAAPDLRLTLAFQLSTGTCPKLDEEAPQPLGTDHSAQLEA